MKRVIICLLLALIFLPTAIAQSNNTRTPSNDSKIKINKGFSCLEKKIADCSDLSVQEIALTILASPEKGYRECLTELQKRMNNDGGFGSIRDTALAILALSQAKVDTNKSENYLISKSRSPENLYWYLEQDSEGVVNCNIKYGGDDYSITIGANKKIDKDAGKCLKRAHSNFWFRIDPSCYGKKISISCDKEGFKTALLYKDKNKPTIYVLEGTQTTAQYKTAEWIVNSKCFGEKSCDYEGTVWATYALLKVGRSIEDYVPYIIALSGSNKRFLPEAFVFAITNIKDYASDLIAAQRLGNYWLAENSAYDKFYDTALAILALGETTSQQVKLAKDWLLYSQGSSGCWGNSIRDTSMVLWAIGQRQPKGGYGGDKVFDCKKSGFYCLPRGFCPSNETLKNYHCASSLSSVCCKNRYLKTCKELGGLVCKSGEECTGVTYNSSDGPCCLRSCVTKGPTVTECEDSGYSCKSSCSSSEEAVSLSCNDNSLFCCKRKTTKGPSGIKGSSVLWIIVIIMILALIVVGFIFRKRLKEIWLKFRRKSPPAPPTTRYPPRFPPLPPSPLQRRIPIRRAPPIKREFKVPQKTLTKTEEDPFKKLREISDK